MRKLYLIDGMSLVFRAFFAMGNNSRLMNKSGEPTGALLGFVNIITSFLDREKPEYAAVAFDRPEPTFRHIMYPEYKATRDAFPEDLQIQLPKIKKFLELAGIKQVEVPGFEADDIIGTLSHRASQSDWQVYCLTADKDYYQLVKDNVFLIKPGKKGEDFELVNIEGVAEKFGVSPEKVIDVLALTGDSSDNVPGVKGIGEKTAVPLIQKYGTIEDLYENVESVEREASRRMLKENKDNAFLSKKLVTIDTDMTLEINSDDCILAVPKYLELEDFLKSEGFNNIREKWAKKGIETGVEFVPTFDEIQKIDDISTLKLNYVMVTLDNIDDIISKLSLAEMLSFDLETDSLDRDNFEIVGLSVSYIENEAYYFPLASPGKTQKADKELSLFGESNENKQHDDEGNLLNLPFYETLEKLKPILENTKIKKCGQNIKFDAFRLRKYGINPSPLSFDTMIASFLINPDEKHNLDSLSQKWLNYSPVSITKLIGEKKSKQITMRDVDIKTVSDYACEDADLALKLTNVLSKEIEKAGLGKLAFDIEFPLIETLTEMEISGVAVNTGALKGISERITKEAAILTEKIFKESGVEFNIDSPKQLGTILFEKMMIPAGKKTKTGYSTDVHVLAELAPIYPIAGYILDYRSLVKLKSTYVDALPRLINPETGRIHTTYNQTVASTGRLSSTDPNLQNIPIRTDLGKEIRRAFVSQNGSDILLSADYSQIELRIMAFLSEDEHLITAFKEGMDIHTATASKLFGKPLEEIDTDMRRKAKAVNFGIMYGLGSFGLAQGLSISRREAQEIISNYFEKYPGIKEYINRTIESTRQKGYAESLCGRRRYFSDINSKNHTLRTAAERAAINMPVQGTASDMIKIAMNSIHKEIKLLGLESTMILQVHDELVFEVKPDELNILQNLVIAEMQNAMVLGDVPVLVETGTGPDWFSAH